MTLFPMFSLPPSETAAALPLYTDVLMDYERAVPVWQAGNPVIVQGQEAVKGWAFRAILTAKAHWPIFDPSYGCDLTNLVGQPYTSDIKRSEAARYLRDALLNSPYITGVEVLDTTFEGSTVHITARLTTVYGEEEMEFNV